MGEMKTYLLQPDANGLMKQGFFMTDENGTTVCEAKVMKAPLFGAAQVVFTNFLTGRSEEHKVGHVTTTETSGALGTSLFSTNSRFKYDGKNIWDYLHEQGIRIDSHLQGKKLGFSYDISLKGRPLATIATSSPKGKSLLTTKFCLDVTTAEEDLDLAFLVAYTLAKTPDQTFHS